MENRAVGWINGVW